MTGRVLVIEDDADISLGVQTVLSRNGFAVTTAAEGREGLRAFHAERPDIVVLDVGLPEMDGWTVLARIRELSEVPVLMLTALGHEADKVRGLRGGADDYLTKPFGNAEFIARVQVLLRRQHAADPQPEIFDDGIVRMNFSTHEVRVDAVPVSLTPTEYRLLAALVRHRGHVLSPVKLLELAWSDPFGIGPDRVKYSIMRLRRKLGEQPDGDSRIEAVRGFGYRYRDARKLLTASLTVAWARVVPATVLHRTGNRARIGRGHTVRIMRSSAPPVRRSRGRILVVEDDPEAAEFFAHVLTRQGRFAVTHTSDPAAALVLATAQSWNLVLTDLDLPVMSGLELLTALRPLAPRLPVLLVTAHPLEPAAYGHGPDAILTKPVPVDVLVATAVSLAARERRQHGRS